MPSSILPRRLLSTSATGRSPADVSDLIIIGSGIAGAATSLLAAEIYKIPVTLVYAGKLLADCNSFWAQGGIIYRNYDNESGDSAEALAKDIQRAGAGLCHSPAVTKVATEGPSRVRQLLLDSSGIFSNVPFDRTTSGALSLCLEASHSAPRILFTGDHTGRTITTHISKAVERHPLVTLMPNTVVTDLITSTGGHCVGIEALDRSSGATQSLLTSRGTVLATGGLAGIYEHSTNPPGFNALGSSVALARRAGAAVRDLEYVQFHPTALFLPNEPRFLLSEALRGEGAVLRDANGRAFAADYHQSGELAPRDVVARAVFHESQKSPPGHQNVFLDISHRDSDWLHKRFPSIQSHLEQRGFDLGQDALPITPAAHYTCGGISTDLNGRTSVPGLYAVGEAARTGLHGGNRLASTSLLEGLVFGGSVADFLGSEEGIAAQNATKEASNQWALDVGHARRIATLEPLHVQHAAHEAEKLLSLVRRLMWDHVGVSRTIEGLQLAMDTLDAMQIEVDRLHSMYPTLETAAARDAVWSGSSVTASALSNKTSSGAHFILSNQNTGFTGCSRKIEDR